MVRTWKQYNYLPALVCFLMLFAVSDANAVRLEVEETAPAWAHFGAAVLLYLHIGGGTVGIISGAIASIASKGQTLHRIAGRVFVVSMFIAYFIGATVAPFLTEGQRPNFVGAILALYLLYSGVSAAWRREFRAGLAEKIGLIVALGIVAMGAVFMYMGMNSESGTVDGSPPQAFFLFIIAGSIAACGEINALIKRQLNATDRLVRHLWRMCFSFFIASGSFFLGQPQVFPAWFNDSGLNFLFSFLPLVILMLFLAKIRFSARQLQSA